jgi:hypothetical protein
MMVSVLHHGVNVGVKAVDPRAAQGHRTPVRCASLGGITCLSITGGSRSRQVPCTRSSAAGCGLSAWPMRLAVRVNRDAN